MSASAKDKPARVSTPNDRGEESLLKFHQRLNLFAAVWPAIRHDDQLIVVIVQPMHDGNALAGEHLNRLEDAQHIRVKWANVPGM
jgi:hypothetical protein